MWLRVFFPHAIAGPLHKIERELVDIGKGDLRKEIRIRKGDELKDLANSVNIMVRELRDDIKAISDISVEIGELVARARDESPNEAINKIEVANASLQEAITKFKL